ncbi:MAG: YggS family pyridoxal phosphate-dependent enzyme [Eubacterium sp.]
MKMTNCVIAENIESIKKEIPENVIFVGVTKNHSIEDTQAVVDAGIYNLGENKVQEFLAKVDEIKGPVHWHFIGHLQRNKVKYLIGKVDLIHSVHSMELLQTIEKESKKQNVVTKVLIQFNLAEEESKSGFLAEEYKEIFDVASSYLHVQICGLMCIGPMTKKDEEIHKVFKQLKEIYGTIETDYHSDNIQMQYLSMGMTDDYRIAIEEGSTIVRIGRKIFNR